MIATILLSFGVLFLAELGDKSQLMALTFALRYRWWVVLSAITAASVLVNLIAVGVGHFLGAALPTELISLCAAATLIGVGLWTLRETLPGAGADDDETPAPQPKSRSAFLVVLSAFLLAELGDRTMFATMALATKNGWVAVWIGSVVGMVAAGGLAILIGVTVGKHIPERFIAVCSGLLFLYFGALTLLEAFATGIGTPIAAVLAAGLPALAGAALLALRRRAATRVDASAGERDVAEEIATARHQAQ
ncbi:TMEM165/GDT1 family protein [Nocardia yamanashiensis]|uniref:TMEM165/GDT1 family protein n=1 Tax=Nocardia yamanashiensis TaxID=209247 RepID=UPI001E5C1133|nr:TMEM165/GDT1 family protein [Nocardia yamanashiensis]UGT40431.1 TMEM165/GDT1 family protein [Nocardia yamanashiensis]